MSFDTTTPAATADTPVVEPMTAPPAKVVFDVQDLNVFYGAFKAVRDVNLQIHQHEITAFIGPSSRSRFSFRAAPMTKINGAVSPAARAMASITPERMPPNADGSTTVTMVRHLRFPRA